MSTSAIPLVTFILVVIAIFTTINLKVTVPIPFTKKRFEVSYVYPPLLGVLFLWMLGQITLTDIVTGGIVGDKDIQPYSIVIIVLFSSMVCLSLDFTGALAFIAFKIVKTFAHTTRHLFAITYWLCVSCSVMTSNDIVILTLTPVVMYCCRFAKLNPVPYLFAQFHAANLGSLFLLIGNPTNVIVGEAFGIGFAEYTKYMAFPAIVCAASGFIVLYLYYRKEIGSTPLILPDLNPIDYLRDRRGAVVHAIILAACLLMMGLSSFVSGLRLYMIAAGAGILSMVYNFTAYPLTRAALRAQQPPAETPGVHLDDATMRPARDVSGPPLEDLRLTADGLGSDAVRPPSNPAPTSDGAVDSSSDGAAAASEPVRELCAQAIVEALPWNLVPFVFGMFVLVQALLLSGWVGDLADLCVYLMGGQDSINGTSNPQFIATFVMCVVTLLLCNLINNQPATILLTRVLVSQPFRDLVLQAQRGAMFGVIAASNFAALLTQLGALAGILFAGIVALGGYRVTYMQFLKHGLIVTPVVLVLTALAISIVLL